MDDGIIINDNCLGICYSIFDKIYPACLKLIFSLRINHKDNKNWSQEETQLMNISTKLILFLNGEINTAFTQRKILFEKIIKSNDK